MPAVVLVWCPISVGDGDVDRRSVYRWPIRPLYLPLSVKEYHTHPAIGCLQTVQSKEVLLPYNSTMIPTSAFRQTSGALDVDASSNQTLGTGECLIQGSCLQWPNPPRDGAFLPQGSILPFHMTKNHTILFAFPTSHDIIIPLQSPPSRFPSLMEETYIFPFIQQAHSLSFCPRSELSSSVSRIRGYRDQGNPPPLFYNPVHGSNHHHI